MLYEITLQLFIFLFSNPFLFGIKPFGTTELFKKCTFNKKLSIEFVSPISHVTDPKRLSIFTTHSGNYIPSLTLRDSRRHKQAGKA